MTRLTCVLVYAACGWPLFAQGGFNGPGAYVITNLDSGKVVDLDQRSVVQSSASGTQTQIWEVQPAGGGYYYLRNAANGYALDAGGGHQSAPVIGAPFNGGSSQQWRLEPGKDGNLLIVSRLGRTLDVPGGTSRDQAQLQIYDRNGDANQRFIFRSAPGTSWRGGRGQGSWRDRESDRGQPAAGNTIVCSSNSGDRVWCGADTRNGVTLTRQISGSPCRQGDTWGWDNRGIWVDRGCRAEFAINAPGAGFGGPGPGSGTIVCASNSGDRVWCDADTRNGVTLTRQISGSPCRQGETWGWDNRGIWVDRGCRAEFTVNQSRGGRFGRFGGGAARTLVCSSNNGERVWCEADTRGQRVEMIRQISGSPCREGSTWGVDRRGIWVDRGCRAEFSIGR